MLRFEKFLKFLRNKIIRVLTVGLSDSDVDELNQKIILVICNQMI